MGNEKNQERFVRTQEEFDKLGEVKQGETVIIETAADVVISMKANICVYGILKIYSKMNFIYCSRFVAWGNSSVVARENSSVEARGNSSVVAWGNSSVEARENSSVEARGNSSVVAWENSSVEARGNSSVVAWGNSSVEARENSSVEARGNSSVVAWENSSVEARGNSSVVAWGNSSVVAWGNSSVVARDRVFVRLLTVIQSLALYGFSIVSMDVSFKMKIKKAKTATIVKTKFIEDFFNREGVEVKKGSCILYKRVSQDFFTQEEYSWKTLWAVGTTLEHSSWEPDKEECGAGKYHACSTPYFCNEFRNIKGDKYIAIEVKTADTHQWKNPTYPHKITFRKGIVLYECDKFGKKIETIN
jgi:hypothetical protein